MKNTRRRFYRAGLVVAGLLAATTLAEVGFSLRDEYAFPHLNTYAADAKLGVRLRPGGRTTLRFGSKENPITQVEIGPEGYREPLPPPGADDVLVVGDSQVFGLGVSASETFSHVLAEQLRGKPGWSDAQVLNLGVPTYGPDEYLAVLDEVLRTRQPRAVVFALDMVNDLFEASRPNAERHAVLDGWAVRREHVTGSPWPIPYRDVLFGRSHLVYALRRQAAHGVFGVGLGVPSEGGYQDLLSAAAEGVEAERRADEAHALEIRGLSIEANRAYLAFERESALLQKVVHDELLCSGEITSHNLAVGAEWPAREPRWGVDVFRCFRLDTDARPGTVVELEPGAETSRRLRVTAEHLRRAALLRAYTDDNEQGIAELEREPAIRAAAERRNQARAAYVALRGATPPKPLPSTPLSPALRALADVSKRTKARVVVLVLPIDVAVSPSEWRKYGVDPAPDMSVVSSFSQAVTSWSKSLGLETLDTTPLLAAAEPGAFLGGDIHMTPKGHRAVAEGLTALLASVPAAATSESADVGRLEQGTPRVRYSRLPTGPVRDETWCIDAGSAGRPTLACGLEAPRDVYGRALRKHFEPLDGVTLLGREPSELRIGTLDRWLLIHGSFQKPLRLTLRRGPESLSIEVQQKEDGTLRIDPIAPRPDTALPLLPVTPGDPRFTRCAQEHPDDPLGPPDDDCIRTYTDACEMMLACTRGAEYAPPNRAHGSTP